MSTKPKIVFIYADQKKEWNCSHWRSYLPSTFLNRFEGHETSIMPIEDLVNPQSIPVIEKVDIIYIERLISNRIWTYLENWRIKGKKVIFDMDDSYKNLPVGASSYDFWVNGMIGEGDRKFKLPNSPIEQLDWYTKLVDAVSSPSKLILNDWKNFNDHLLWIPNFVDAELYQPTQRHEGKLIVGWGGGATHYTSWYDSGALTALRRVYEKYKSRIQIMLITRDEQLAFKMREFKPIVAKPDRLLYPQEVCKLDIALAPVSGVYDRRRSWLKIAEYSACKTPWIATDYEPYYDYNYPGSILVNNKPAAWEEAMSDMIENYDSYFAKAQESYPLWMKDFSIQENHKFLSDQFLRVLEE